MKNVWNQLVLVLALGTSLLFSAGVNEYPCDVATAVFIPKGIFDIGVALNIDGASVEILELFEEGGVIAVGLLVPRQAFIDGVAMLVGFEFLEIDEGQALALQLCVVYSRAGQHLGAFRLL